MTGLFTVGADALRGRRSFEAGSRWTGEGRDNLATGPARLVTILLAMQERLSTNPADNVIMVCKMGFTVLAPVNLVRVKVNVVR